MISLIMPPKDQVRLVTALLYVVELCACRPLQLVSAITEYESKISDWATMLHRSLEPRKCWVMSLVQPPTSRIESIDNRCLAPLHQPSRG